MKSLNAIAITCLFTACFSTSVKPGVVQKKAASDMSCPVDQVKVEQVNDNNWAASGCAKRATYMCSGSNFMSDGSCMREGVVETAEPARAAAPTPPSS